MYQWGLSFFFFPCYDHCIRFRLWRFCLEVFLDYKFQRLRSIIFPYGFLTGRRKHLLSIWLTNTNTREKTNVPAIFCYVYVEFFLPTCFSTCRGEITVGKTKPETILRQITTKKGQVIPLSSTGHSCWWRFLVFS